MKTYKLTSEVSFIKYGKSSNCIYVSEHKAVDKKDAISMHLALIEIIFENTLMNSLLQESEIMY